MKLREIYSQLTGVVEITVEGFFLERFINSCFSNDIFLMDLVREKSTFLRVKVGIKDFKKLKTIARKTKCKVKIKEKSGIPIIINKYRKRKIFAIASLVIAIFILFVTRFIWNIEINGLVNISETEMMTLLNENGIILGKPKSDLDLEKIINKIRIQRDDISWIGIDIKGTNVIVNISEADSAPEIIDISEPCNIVADRDGIISSMIVHNGTARVSIGDEVKKGDLLVEGIMEGQYTGIREVHAAADILVKKSIEKEEKATLLQDIEIKTGNVQKKIEIKLNKFKINFNKRVSNFEKYDTIKTTKKLRFFSNYYLPIEISKIIYCETKVEQKEYTVEELAQELKEKISNELDSEYGITNKENIEENLEMEVQDGTVVVKVIYIIEEKIGTKEVK